MDLARDIDNEDEIIRCNAESEFKSISNGVLIHSELYTGCPVIGGQ